MILRQLILFPWGYTETPAPGYDAMYALAMKGYDALHAVHGEFYEVPASLRLSPGPGGLHPLRALHGRRHLPRLGPWGGAHPVCLQVGRHALYTGTIDLLSIELRDTGSYGFLLPPSKIIPTAEETWAFHKVRRRLEPRTAPPGRGRGDDGPVRERLISGVGDQFPIRPRQVVVHDWNTLALNISLQ
jgi:hypothetical protein